MSASGVRNSWAKIADELALETIARFQAVKRAIGRMDERDRLQGTLSGSRR